jgi:selenocysteine-specific elongation factor
VPGHERLIKTMVAGASSIDAVLLVIAADEGVSLQTREHFDILQLLGIERGVIALTKIDLVSHERLQEVTNQVKAFLKGSFLEGASIIPVSAVDGRGVDDLKQTLMELGQTVEKRRDSGIFRMPIDRVFTMRGFGTVIAGTILSGEVREGDKIEIYPDGITTKIRGIQVHHRKVKGSVFGRRTALNLQDVKKELLRRGQCAGEPGSLTPTYRLDASLRLLDSYEKQLKNRTRIRLHVGTAELISRVILLEKDALSPGEETLAQFVLEAPTVALPGDRFVIRTFSPLMTIGGGSILDSTPSKHKRHDSRALLGLRKLGGDVDEMVEQVVRNSGTKPMRASDIRLKIGKREDLVEQTLGNLEKGGRIVGITEHKEARYLHKHFSQELEKELPSQIQSYLSKHPDSTYMPYEELRSKFLKLTDDQTFKAIFSHLEEKKRISRKDADVTLAGYKPRLKPQDREAVRKIEQTYRIAGFSSPLKEDVRVRLGLNPRAFQEALHILYGRGELVRLSEKVVYHRESIEKARRIVLQYLEKYPSISVADLRDVLKLSRKYATALLEYFDTIGLTKREKDVHILK